MSTFYEEDEARKIEEEISKGKNNPWAICTSAVGRKDKDKYERCVMDVKRRLGHSEEASLFHDFPTLQAALKGKICKNCAKTGLLDAHQCSNPEACLCPSCLVDAGIDPDVVAKTLFASLPPQATITPQSPLYEDEDEAGKAGKHKGGGEHMAFDTCVQKMSHRKGVKDPEALCAYIGRRGGHHKMEENEEEDELGKKLTEEEKAIAEEVLAEEEAFPPPAASSGGRCPFDDQEFGTQEELDHHLSFAHGLGKSDEDEAYEEVEEEAEEFYEAASDLMTTLQAGLVERVATFAASVDENFFPFTPTSPTAPPLTKNLDGTPAANPVDTPYSKTSEFWVEVGWFAKTLDQISAIVDNFEAYMDEFHFRDKGEVEAYKEHNKKLGNDWMDFKNPPKHSKRYWNDTERNLGK